MNLLEEIRSGESKKLELKEKFTSNLALAKTVVAFSNTSGGKIVIGVKDNKEIIGVNENEIFKLQDKIASAIYDSCYPIILPEIYNVNIGGKIVIVIEVFRGSLLPYFLKSKGKLKGTYVRLGATNRLADEKFIEDLERQRIRRTFDEEENRDFNIEDLDLEIIYNEFSKIGKKVNKSKLTNLGLIKTRKRTHIPTNALIITLGKFGNTSIKCARFKGISMDVFIDEKEFDSNLFENLDNSIAFLKNHLSLHAKIEGLKRKEWYEIPIIALREALINALIHRDYAINSDIKVAIYDDIVEITSPGAFPNGITLEDISNGRSELRNKILANLFKELGYIEAWGSGIAKINSLCNKNNIKFKIEEKANFVRVVFQRPNTTEYDRIRPNTTDLYLNKILDFIMKNGNIKRKDVMKLLKCKETKAKETLSQLMKENIISRKGKGKNTYYVINPDFKN